MTFYEEMIHDKKKHHDRFRFILLLGTVIGALTFIFFNPLLILLMVITTIYFMYTCYNVLEYNKAWEETIYKFFFNELNIVSIEMMNVEENKVNVYKDLYKYDSVIGHQWILIKNAIEISLKEICYANTTEKYVIPHILTIKCRRPDVFNFNKIFWLRVNFNNGVTVKININKYMRKDNCCAYYGNFLKEATL